MGRAQQRKISLRRIGRRGGRSNPSQRQKVQKSDTVAHRTEGREKQPVPTSEAEWTDGNQHHPGKRKASTQPPHPEKRAGRSLNPTNSSSVRELTNHKKRRKTMDTKMNNSTPTQSLTRGEEEIMQILWQLGEATVNEVIACTREPHPKYTTVATFLKILENKGFVGHTAEGKSHRYHPLVAKESYARNVMQSMLGSYFNGSLAQMVSFFSQHEQISIKEMEEILEIMHSIRK